MICERCEHVMVVKGLSIDPATDYWFCPYCGSVVLTQEDDGGNTSITKERVL